MKALRKLSIFLSLIISLFIFNEQVITPVYSQLPLSYTAYFNTKKSRVESIDGNKLIVLGGSSACLGFDSQYFEEETGIPCANMAIAAGIPLSAYLSIGEEYAKKGDIVLLVLEETYFMVPPLQINEEYVDLVAHNKKLNAVKTPEEKFNYCKIEFFRSFSRLPDIINYSLQKSLSTRNVYSENNVNSYGDFVAHKGATSTYVQKRTTAPLFKENPETMKTLSDYVNTMNKKGVQVCITYAPTDASRYTNSFDFFSALQSSAESHIPAENLLGTPFDFHYPPSFFFDTIHHINYENRQSYTQQIISALNTVNQTRPTKTPLSSPTPRR